MKLKNLFEPLVLLRSNKSYNQVEEPYEGMVKFFNYTPMFLLLIVLTPFNNLNWYFKN